MTSAMSPSRDTSMYTSTKGLLNEPGQNNCFLNSAVQVLWHLDIFRRSFRDLSGHACMAESCIFCALKELFSQLQFSNETALPPDALRRALAESFYNQQRFQLGFMDDAAECFENMLLRIHTHIAHGESEDMCNAKHCIPHQKFAMTLVEQSVCGACGASSEPLPFNQMVHYVSASALTTQSRQIQNHQTYQTSPDSFGQILHKAGGMGDIRECPSACGNKIQIRRSLMNRPEIVSVGVVWDSERPTLDHIMDVFAAIGTTLRLADIFHSVVDNRWGSTTLHTLVGVVTYYGKHYSTFFFHSKLRVWIYFDDATVREVGPKWEQVVEKCRRGRYQPLLLLYAVPNGTPVSTENAPKQVVPLYEKSLKSSQSIMRRSVTPSPEKPNVGNTRRAITPNPEGSFVQKPPLSCPVNEYQNLTAIQGSIYAAKSNMREIDTVDGDLGSREPDYITRKKVESMMCQQQKTVNAVQRTLSNGSSSGLEGICVPEHMNIPRRRDSGNWSGDRNSASSSSSTSMENPYMYLLGKLPHTNGGSIPGSPTRGKSDSLSGSSGVFDAGYDSYSISSNDSSAMATVQHLMKQGHLAKIPEDYNNQAVQQFSISCDVLCDEADELLNKSRQMEDEHDLVLALALCNAAATKARAAMNAPYNNPQTLTLARMKHNTCIMRARSLHRRITQTQNPTPKESYPEIRHTREGSSGSGRHSRQNSRDKTHHSRQNSKELLVVPPVSEKSQVQTKNIEIYATLPKKKGLLKSKSSSIDIDADESYVLYDKPPARESRSLLSRVRGKDDTKVKEKRSRSEDRNKIFRDFSIASSSLFSNAKDTLKKEKQKEDPDDKKDKSGKKQHKIRRKLLMGGLIKRKNRSMPDLTEVNSNIEVQAKKEPLMSSVDDSSVGLKASGNNNAMSGYLSEGHLEYTGNSTNPNLERSRLMRKSFHGSAGKVLTAAKVPPPPPLRTTSQLTSNKPECEENSIRKSEYLPYGSSHKNSYVQNQNGLLTRDQKLSTSNSSPYLGPYSGQNDIKIYKPENIIRSNTVTTQADVHQEQSPVKRDQMSNQTSCNQLDSGIDEVDCLPRFNSQPKQLLDLPPYPSPAGSIIHSRQGSAEFPAPPPPLDLTALDEHLQDHSRRSPSPPPPPNSLLSQLQNKRLEILSHEEIYKYVQEPKSSGDVWLRELQAKQEALKIKKHRDSNSDLTNASRYINGEMGSRLSIDSLKSDSSKLASVRDLASKFENIQVQPNTNWLQNSITVQKANNVSVHQANQLKLTTAIQPEHFAQSFRNKTESPVNTGVLSLKKREDRETISATQIAAEIDEVEKLSAAVHITLNSNSVGIDEIVKKNRPMKKKSVSFCDQVILVATADEQEDEAYIPNPILERVLRTAFKNSDDESENIESVNRVDKKLVHAESIDAPLRSESHGPYGQQDVACRRNSMENLLSSSIGSVGSVNFGNLQERDREMPSPQNLNFSNQSISQQNHYPPPEQKNLSLSNSSPMSVSSIPPYSQPQFDCSYREQREFGHMPRQPYNTTIQQVRASPISSNFTGYASNPQYQHHVSQVYNGYSHQSPPSLANQQSANLIYFQQNRPQVQPPYYHPPTQQHQRFSQQCQEPIYPPYQRVPNCDNQQFSSNGMHGPYQRVPIPLQNGNCNTPYQPVPQHYGLYQTNLNGNEPCTDLKTRMEDPVQRQQSVYQYPPYHQVLPPKVPIQQKKTVSFEPGTKGGTESPTPKAVITPIIVNPPSNNNNNINKCINSTINNKQKCNLCRKKYVVSTNLYCTDCEFYMSRFKPKS